MTCVSLLYPKKTKEAIVNLLAINTAFLQADLAFVDNNQKRYARVDSNCKHSEVVMNQIDCLLGETRVLDLDAMAVVVGTGSFTGIRISIAIAEGFKTANPNLDLVAINSFELACHSLKNTSNQKYAIVFNALGGRYFVQYFLGSIAQSDFLLVNEDEIENVKKFGLKSENLDFCDEYFEFSPQTLCKIAEEKVNAKQFVDFLQPLYIRKSQAEEQLDKKNEN